MDEGRIGAGSECATVLGAMPDRRRRHPPLGCRPGGVMRRVIPCHMLPHACIFRPESKLLQRHAVWEGHLSRKSPRQQRVKRQMAHPSAGRAAAVSGGGVQGAGAGRRHHSACLLGFRHPNYVWLAPGGRCGPALGSVPTGQMAGPERKPPLQLQGGRAASLRIGSRCVARALLFPTG